MDTFSPKRIISSSMSDLRTFNRDFNGPAIYATHDWPLGIRYKLPEEKLTLTKKDFRKLASGGKVAAKLFKLCKNRQSVYVCSHMHFYLRDTVCNNVDGEDIPVEFIALDKTDREDKCFDVFDFPDSDADGLNAMGIYDANTMT